MNQPTMGQQPCPLCGDFHVGTCPESELLLDRTEPPPGWRWHERQREDGTWETTRSCTPDLPALADLGRAWEYHDDAVRAALAFYQAENDRLTADVARLEGGQRALTQAILDSEAERDQARATLAEASRVWDGPETGDWVEGVTKEAAHQVVRWGKAHDDGKGPEDFFWTLGYLASKALRAAIQGDLEKAKHHTISSAALLRNWHARLSGEADRFRPGIETPDV